MERNIQPHTGPRGGYREDDKKASGSSKDDMVKEAASDKKQNKRKNDDFVMCGVFSYMGNITIYIISYIY